MEKKTQIMSLILKFPSDFIECYMKDSKENIPYIIFQVKKIVEDDGHKEIFIFPKNEELFYALYEEDNIDKVEEIVEKEIGKENPFEGFKTFAAPPKELPLLIAMFDSENVKVFHKET